MDQHIVITIARQYGSGGREIGVKLAELLNVKSYDKELITMAAQKSGISIDEISSADEKATSSLLYTLALGSSAYGNSSARFNMPLNDKLFVVQSEIIREIAEREECVIIGRCGDYVLREAPHVMSFFIYSDESSRIKRVAQRHELSEEAAKDLIAKTDKRRINYYNFYTGRKWGKFDHYSASINSAVLGIEGTARLIADMVNQYKEKNEMS